MKLECFESFFFVVSSSHAGCDVDATKVRMRKNVVDPTVFTAYELSFSSFPFCVDIQTHCQFNQLFLSAFGTEHSKNNSIHGNEWNKLDDINGTNRYPGTIIIFTSHNPK